MKTELLNQAIADFKSKHKNCHLNRDKDYQERRQRESYYRKFDAAKIKAMTTDEFYEYFGNLWSMMMWGNKKYVVDKIINDNGLDNLKAHLTTLLYGTGKISARWDDFLKNIKGVGPSTISELLCYVNPYEYSIFNKITVKCFSVLGIENLPAYNYQFNGKRYEEACRTAKEIAAKMLEAGLKDVSLLVVDYLLWDEIYPLSGTENPPVAKIATQTKPAEKEAIHDDIKQKIVEIGKFLGFESRAEVAVSKGAIVDVIWEANIGNMGKAIYVFEVQSKGSIDSLLLNLIRSRSNPAVQAVVAVSDKVQIERIKGESCHTELENCLKTWEFDEVNTVHGCLEAAHMAINRLELVPDSFL